MRDLIWAFRGPNLLEPSAFLGVVEPDSTTADRLSAHEQDLKDLARDPSPLLNFLCERTTNGRLGRYFEHLLQFYLVRLAKVERLECNVQIREGKRTLGELDLVFREAQRPRPQHWEVSVKFYLCVTQDPQEALKERFFMGTLVEDRMDIKIAKLVGRQRQLPLHPSADEILSTFELAQPESYAVLKGLIFYPCEGDWQNAPHPATISPGHRRGWWTTSALKTLPSESSLYFLLPQNRWLSPFEGPVAQGSLMTATQVRTYIEAYFSEEPSSASDLTRLLARELTFAEVDLITGGEVRELSRGHIVHAAWPAHARAAALLDR